MYPCYWVQLELHSSILPKDVQSCHCSPAQAASPPPASTSYLDISTVDKVAQGRIPNSLPERVLASNCAASIFAVEIGCCDELGARCR
jgi:hypothetical protein